MLPHASLIMHTKIRTGTRTGPATDFHTLNWYNKRRRENKSICYACKKWHNIEQDTMRHAVGIQVRGSMITNLGCGSLPNVNGDQQINKFKINLSLSYHNDFPSFAVQARLGAPLLMKIGSFSLYCVWFFILFYLVNQISSRYPNKSDLGNLNTYFSILSSPPIVIPIAKVLLLGTRENL